MLNEHLPQYHHEEWKAHILPLRAPSTAENSPQLNPQQILDELQRQVPEDTVFATDVGQHQMWTAQHFEFRQPRTLLTSGGLGTMGYGLGAAIGAQAAFPDRRVVLVSGDGSFHMNLNELTTLASYDLPIVVVVMNNRVLGMVRQWQKVFYGRRFSATDPHRKTDLVKLAEAFGCTGMRITAAGEVEPSCGRPWKRRAPSWWTARSRPTSTSCP